MNNSKKTIRGPQKAKKTVITTNRRLWLIPSIILGVLLIAGLLFDQLYERVLITIDDEKYHQSDLNYYFFAMESTYSTYAQLFGWDMPYDEENGYTLGDVAKQEALRTALEKEVLYREAIEAGYSLTTEENDMIADDIASMLSGIPADTIKKNGFTNKYLTDVLGTIVLADRYRADIIDTLDIDDEAIAEEIIYDDYRQYDIEYLFISTETTDESGNTVAMNEEEKAAAYEKLAAIYDKALTTEDWSALLPEDEEELAYSSSNFTKISDTYSEDMETMMMTMENGAVSEIYEEEDGYYIVKMVNNNSTVSYDTAVKNAVTAEENTAFNTYFDENILNKHTIKLHERAIRALKMGSITL